MTDFPMNIVSEFGPSMGYFIYALIGLFFGFVLESAGFGNSRKLAAQFYFKELTVFKVMFTAIVVAMVLIFFCSAIGLLDYQLLWVNPTYLWPGIAGGFIMGVGFIVGGFCPGTSLVAAATLKLDGLFFVFGALFGILIFGDTVDFYSTFFHGSFYDRITLPDILGISYGVTVLLIVLLALLMFWGADWIEHTFSHFPKPPQWRMPAAAAIVALAIATLMLGQPTLEDRWQRIAAIAQPRIDAREIYASPLEVATLQKDRKLKVRILDIRLESDFNRFHIRDAEHTSTSNVEQLAQALIGQPPNTVNIITGNDEIAATETWKQLRAAGVPSLYVLEGGVNGWLQTFAPPGQLQSHSLLTPAGEPLRFTFERAMGSRYPMASPNLAAYPELTNTKVKLEIKRAPAGGGCG